MIDIADDQGGHARAPLLRRDVDIDLGMAEDRDDRLGKLLVEVVGEDVDEVDDPRARLLRAGLVQAQSDGAAGE